MGRGSSKAGGNARALQSGTIGKAKFTANGSSVSQQTVTVKSGNDELQVYFSSGYSPQQATNSTQAIKSGIYAITKHNGDVTAYRVLTETKTKSIKSAKKNYDSVLDAWKKITKQKQITF